MSAWFQYGHAMNERVWFVALSVIIFCCQLIRTEDCAPPIKRRKQGAAARRYQPKTIQCEECEPQHKNLLLLGVHAHEEKLKKCLLVEKIEGSTNLKSTLPDSEPQTIVLVLPTSDWVPETRVLDVMVERLGNVSILASGNNLGGGLLHHCHNLGAKCYQLDNLMPVISQIEILNTHGKSAATDDVAKALLELYNARWSGEETNGTVGRQKTPALHRQMDQLIGELCKRDQSSNKLVKILKSSKPASKNDIMDDSEHFGVNEVSLSIGDILPKNPKSYDKNRPPKRAGHPTVVYFHVTVLSLDSINEESMTYVADIFLAQSWRDSRLRLPENMSEEYRILDVEWLKYIWRPDCFFKNAKKVTFHEMSIPNHYLWLYHDKTLLYMAKLTLVLSCAMKFESYPHDTQICSMMIESLSHTTHDLVFIWNITDPLVVNPEIELPQLDISNNYTTDCTLTYSTGNFTCLAVVFTLRRRLGYHLFHTYIPSALIVVMSWIAFWIKPEAIPARVTLGVTSLLTLATQNTQSQQNLPPVSYVKAIDIWMSSCSVFVFLSLMEFAVVNNYMGPVATKAMKGFSEEDLRSTVDEYRDLSLRGRGQARASVHTVPQYPTCYGKETALYIDKFSRFFFPFSFFILNVVYWSTFL